MSSENILVTISMCSFIKLVIRADPCPTSFTKSISTAVIWGELFHQGFKRGDSNEAVPRAPFWHRGYTQVTTFSKESEADNVIFTRFSDKMSKQGPQLSEFLGVSRLMCCQGLFVLSFVSGRRLYCWSCRGSGTGLWDNCFCSPTQLQFEITLHPLIWQWSCSRQRQSLREEENFHQGHSFFQVKC